VPRASAIIGRDYSSEKASIGAFSLPAPSLATVAELANDAGKAWGCLVFAVCRQTANFSEDFILEIVLSPTAACPIAETPPPIPQCPLRISLRRQSLSRAKVRWLRLRYTRNNIVPFFPEGQIIRYDAHKSRTAKQTALHCPSDRITLTFPPPPPLCAYN
jgi:hypothetical protein